MCDAHNRSRRQTQFTVLPNEIIYAIFDFLTTCDIVRAFVQINHRYDDLVQFYVKRLDLTDGWQGDRQQLQWIFETIQTLKIDQFHIHLLADQEWLDRDDVTSTEQIPFVADYRFSQLHSLHLVNVSDWNKVISSMNLKSLNLWFNGHIRYYHGEGLIPQTIIRFSTNAVLEANTFHMNLIDLNVRVRSIVHLLEIVERTPNVQHLSITFADYFYRCYVVKTHQSDLFETMVTNFSCLSNLSRLSFATKDARCTESNENLPFNQIQVFIDRCCPNKTILKKVALKLDHIMFNKTMWSSIVRYKNTFDHFDFYASFMVKEYACISMEILSNNNDFDFHLEGNDSSHPQDRYMHIYSLPFAFDTLHGFTLCSTRTLQSSFSTVRHLYFIQTDLARPTLFESLAKRMPHLVSIDCDFSCVRGYETSVPEVIADEDIFNNVRFLRFMSHCWNRECFCRNLLLRLLDRMPHVQCLITLDDTFIHGQRPRPSIKQLDLQRCNFESFDTIAQLVPHLSTLSLDQMILHVESCSRLVASLFIRLSSLSLVSFKFNSFCGNDRAPYRNVIEQALVHVQNMNNRVLHLRLTFGYGLVTFYLQK